MSEIPDLTFSMDADEEKHILYEKTEVPRHITLILCASHGQLYFNHDFWRLKISTCFMSGY